MGYFVNWKEENVYTYSNQKILVDYTKGLPKLVLFSDSLAALMRFCSYFNVVTILYFFQEAHFISVIMNRLGFSSFDRLWLLIDLRRVFTHISIMRWSTDGSFTSVCPI